MNSFTPSSSSAYADKEGETVAVKLIRDGKPLQLDLKIKLMEVSNWKLQRLPTSTPQQKELLANWLGGK
jgi:hypothetical protein